MNKKDPTKFTTCGVQLAVKYLLIGYRQTEEAKKLTRQDEQAKKQVLKLKEKIGIHNLL